MQWVLRNAPSLMKVHCAPRAANTPGSRGIAFRAQHVEVLDALPHKVHGLVLPNGVNRVKDLNRFGPAEGASAGCVLHNGKGNTLFARRRVGVQNGTMQIPNFAGSQDALGPVLEKKCGCSFSVNVHCFASGAAKKYTARNN